MLGIASDVANSSLLHLTFPSAFPARKRICGVESSSAPSAERNKKKTRSFASVTCLLLPVEELSSTKLQTTSSSSFVLPVAR